MLLSPLQAQDLHIILLNGDCDGDNEVTLFDFGIVVNAMGTTPNDPNWDPRADLDGDLEVTLFDYGIVVRNFGEIGAEPFDPTLPRRPAPSEGYKIIGLVELEAWQGEPFTLEVEARRYDDPEQVVYCKQIQTGQYFEMFLPQSGFWIFKVRGFSHFLGEQTSPNREYASWPPILVVVNGVVSNGGVIRPDEEVADGRFGGGNVSLTAHVVDYDTLKRWDARRTLREPLTNYQRQPEYLELVEDQAGTITGQQPTFQYVWQVSGVEPGGVDIKGATIDLSIPTLDPDETRREVIVTVAVSDVHPDPAVQDTPRGRSVRASFRFYVVNKCTMHPRVSTRVVVGQPPNNVITNLPTPIPSGYDYQNENGHKVFLVFSTGARIREQDSIQSVQWTTPWGTFSGDNMVVGPIPPDTEHGYFSFTANVTITKRDFDPDANEWVEKPVTLSESRERIMAFDFATEPIDEWLNTDRGRYNWDGQDYVDNPPNWFDDRPKHWGSIIPNMNKTEENGKYIVHFAGSVQLTDPEGKPVAAKFDWRGDLAPTQYRNAPAYRGRIYVFPAALWGVSVDLLLRRGSKTEWLLGSGYGLRTDKIDFTAVVVAHELAHRELFLRAWGSFNDADIGSPGNWLPGSAGRDRPDSDGDEVMDTYENSAEGQRFKFNKESKNAILQWWTGETIVDNPDEKTKKRYELYTDAEMYAQLWGENAYKVGSLVILFNQEGEPVVSEGQVRIVGKDWSRDGWLDRLYPHGGLPKTP